MSNETVWKCVRRESEGDGGYYTNVEYAKSRTDMLVLKDQGFKCWRMVDAGGSAPPVWVED